MIPELHTVLGLLESGFGRLEILVVGDLMLDRYIHGEVDRISPEAPVPVLHHARRYDRAGGAANVAMNLVGLGCSVSVAGFWGNDPEAAEVQKLLTGAGIGCSGVVATDLPTVSKTRIIGRQQQLLRVDVESREHPGMEYHARLLGALYRLLRGVSAVILSDYSKGVVTPELCARVIAQARSLGIPVLVDPKTPDLGRYAGATVVCPNLNELSVATGVKAEMLDQLLIAGESQRKQHGFEHLAVTMSEKGIRVLSNDGSYYSPARARQVFDVSGAGDTVIAMLAAGLAAGLGLAATVELANRAAGIVVGKVGTVPISRHDLILALTPSSDISAVEKIQSREHLVSRLAEWRAAGETAVFTNGCFDILHVGHITLLESCRTFGSKLIVGLNTDASVKRLKGPSRPVIGETERARVIASLAAVDSVVLFDEDTPLELIRALQPDVLVKGGDYTVDTVVGHEEVIAAGGRVEIVPTIEGYSTSHIVQKLEGR